MLKKIADANDVVRRVQQIIDRASLVDLEQNIHEIFDLLKGMPLEIALQVVEDLLRRMVNNNASTLALVAEYARKIYEFEALGQKWNELRTQWEAAVRLEGYKQLLEIIKQTLELGGMIKVREACIITLGQHGELKFSELPSTTNSQIKSYFLDNSAILLETISSLTGHEGRSSAVKTESLGDSDQQLFIRYISNGQQVCQIIMVIASSSNSATSNLNHLNYLATLAQFWEEFLVFQHRHNGMGGGSVKFFLRDLFGKSS